MNNNTLGKIILYVWGGTILVTFFSEALGEDVVEGFYGLFGLCILVFSIWAAIRLIKS